MPNLSPHSIVVLDIEGRNCKVSVSSFLSIAIVFKQSSEKKVF